MAAFADLGDMHMTRRRAIHVLVGAAVPVLVAVLAPPAMASTGPCVNGYEWMGQYTSIYPQNETGSNWSCSVDSPYYGWSGLDGNITTPLNIGSPTTANHDVGWIGMNFNSIGNDIKHIQMGFYIGKVGRLSSTTQYRVYEEVYNPVTDQYWQNDYGYLDLGQDMTYRIQYSGTGTTWTYYDNYNIALGSWDAGFTSGQAEATRELWNQTSTVASGEFGSATAGTNATLRVRGGSGYQDWDSALTVDYTTKRDFSTYSPSCKYSQQTAYYHFDTYSI